MGLQIVFEVWSEMYMYTGYDERKGFEKKMGSGSQPNGWHSSLRPVEWQSCYLGKYRNVAWRGLPSRAQGSYLTLGNESSKEVRGLTQQDFPGKGPWGREQQSKGTQENSVPCGFQSQVLCEWSEFPVCLWPIILTQSFLVVRASLNQDGFQQEGFWDIDRTYGLESPLSFWPFLNSSGWW